MRSQEKRLIPVCITRTDGEVFYCKCTPEEFIIKGGGELAIVDGDGYEFKDTRGEPSGKKPLTREYKKKDYIKSIKKLSETEFKNGIRKQKELKRQPLTKDLK